MDITFIQDSYFYLNMPIMEAITNILFFPMQYCGFLLSHVAANLYLFETLSKNYGLSYDAIHNGCYIISWYFWCPVILWLGARYLK
jgi:hypothetical protein